MELGHKHVKWVLIIEICLAFCGYSSIVVLRPRAQQGHFQNSPHPNFPLDFGILSYLLASYQGVIPFPTLIFVPYTYIVYITIGFISFVLLSSSVSLLDQCTHGCWQQMGSVQGSFICLCTLKERISLPLLCPFARKKMCNGRYTLSLVLLATPYFSPTFLEYYHMQCHAPIEISLVSGRMPLKKRGIHFQQCIFIFITKTKHYKEVFKSQSKFLQSLS